MTYEEAKQRTDYKFTLNGIETLIEDIRNNYMGDMYENGDIHMGVAVLEVGCVDIEVNIATEEQVARNGDKIGNKSPVIDYFTCKKYGKGPYDWESDQYLDYNLNVDWSSNNWDDQLEKDMFKALDDYVTNNDLSYDIPIQNKIN